MTYQSQHHYNPEQEHGPESIFRGRKTEIWAGVAEIHEARHAKPMPEVLVPASVMPQYPEQLVQHHEEAEQLMEARLKTKEELEMEQLRNVVEQLAVDNPLQRAA